MKPVIKKRIIAFLIDYVPLCFLSGFVSTSVLMVSPNGSFKPVFNIFMFIATVIWCLKDIFNGAGISKRIMKIKVVDENFKTPPIYKLILRNLLELIWPLQAYFLVAKEVGFNDIVTKTQVVEV